MPLSLNEIQNQSCRDLWWALHAPSMLQSCPTGAYPCMSCPQSILKAGLAGFLDLMNDPTPLEDYLAARPQNRLGHYFEDLVNFWILELAQCPGHSHIQFNQNKQTLGECDLIFKHQEKWQWWEMTVKFYCLDRDAKNPHDWCGIRSQDRLSIKYNHMMLKQLPLSAQPFIRSTLSEKNISGNVKYHM
ncbi:MAG: DUF1853 family protein [Planctomycetes bacterium]|nr:DUF1853 family protein [Planctomycetota bacterium]